MQTNAVPPTGGYSSAVAPVQPGQAVLSSGFTQAELIMQGMLVRAPWPPAHHMLHVDSVRETIADFLVDKNLDLEHAVAGSRTRLESARSAIAPAIRALNKAHAQEDSHEIRRLRGALDDAEAAYRAAARTHLAAARAASRAAARSLSDDASPMFLRKFLDQTGSELAPRDARLGPQAAPPFMTEPEAKNFTAALRRCWPDHGPTVQVQAVSQALGEVLDEDRQATHLQAPELWCAMDRGAELAHGTGIEWVEAAMDDAQDLAQAINPLRHLRSFNLTAGAGFDTARTVDLSGLEQHEGKPARQVEINFTAPMQHNPDSPLVVIVREDMPVFQTGDPVTALLARVSADGSLSDIIDMPCKPQVDPRALI